MVRESVLELKVLTAEEKVRRAGLTLGPESCLVICYSKGVVSKCRFWEVRLKCILLVKGPRSSSATLLSVSWFSFVHRGALAIHSGGPSDLVL